MRPAATVISKLGCHQTQNRYLKGDNCVLCADVSDLSLLNNTAQGAAYSNRFEDDPFSVCIHCR